MNRYAVTASLLYPGLNIAQTATPVYEQLCKCDGQVAKDESGDAAMEAIDSALSVRSCFGMLSSKIIVSTHDL